MKKMLKKLISLALILALTLCAPAGAAAADDPDFAQTAPFWLLTSLEKEVIVLTNQMQGACTDGRYIWAGWNNRLTLTRLDLTTWELESREHTEDDWRFGHINDLTYNPNTNRLYVVAFMPGEDATRGDIAVIDPITLEFLELIQLKHNGSVLWVSGLAYDRTRSQYIAAVSGNGERKLAILDEDFQVVGWITCDTPVTLTVQGIETDGEYIYRALWDFNVTNVIQVFDYDGRFVTQIETGTNGRILELEDVMYDWNGNWYVNFSHRNGRGGSIYYTQFTPPHDTSNYENMLGRLPLEPSMLY